MSTETSAPKPSLAVLAAIPITEAIPAETLARALANPPFIDIPGAVNFRSVGTISVDGRQLRPGFVFRSGNLSRITEEGKERLVNELSVEKIFDLRHEKELKGTPRPKIEGVNIVWMKMGKEMAVNNMQEFADDELKAFTNMYVDILEVYTAYYTTIFRHILTSPNEPFVFHCTGGKDRTGVFAALLLSLAAFSREEIAADYALTRIGVEPAREMLLKIMQRDQGFDLQATGTMQLATSRPENMLAFLEVLGSKFDGAEGYMKKELGFKAEEVEQIKKNLLAPV